MKANEYSNWLTQLKEEEQGSSSTYQIFQSFEGENFSLFEANEHALFLIVDLFKKSPEFSDYIKSKIEDTGIKPIEKHLIALLNPAIRKMINSTVSAFHANQSTYQHSLDLSIFLLNLNETGYQRLEDIRVRSILLRMRDWDDKPIAILNSPSDDDLESWLKRQFHFLLTSRFLQYTYSDEEQNLQQAGQTLYNGSDSVYYEPEKPFNEEEENRLKSQLNVLSESLKEIVINLVSSNAGRIIETFKSKIRDNFFSDMRFNIYLLKPRLEAIAIFLMSDNFTTHQKLKVVSILIDGGINLCAGGAESAINRAYLWMSASDIHAVKNIFFESSAVNLLARLSSGHSYDEYMALNQNHCVNALKEEVGQDFGVKSLEKTFISIGKKFLSDNPIVADLLRKELIENAKPNQLVLALTDRFAEETLEGLDSRLATIGVDSFSILKTINETNKKRFLAATLIRRLFESDFFDANARNAYKEYPSRKQDGTTFRVEKVQGEGVDLTLFTWVNASYEVVDAIPLFTLLMDENVLLEDSFRDDIVNYLRTGKHATKEVAHLISVMIDASTFPKPYFEVLLELIKDEGQCHLFPLVEKLIFSLSHANNLENQHLVDLLLIFAPKLLNNAWMQNLSPEKTVIDDGDTLLCQLMHLLVRNPTHETLITVTADLVEKLPPKAWTIKRVQVSSLGETPLRELMTALGSNPKHETLIRVAADLVEKLPPEAWVTELADEDSQGDTPLRELMAALAQNSDEPTLIKITADLVEKLPPEAWIINLVQKSLYGDTPLRQLMSALAETPKDPTLVKITAELVEKLPPEAWIINFVGERLQGDTPLCQLMSALAETPNDPTLVKITANLVEKLPPEAWIINRDGESVQGDTPLCQLMSALAGNPNDPTLVKITADLVEKLPPGAWIINRVQGDTPLRELMTALTQNPNNPTLVKVAANLFEQLPPEAWTIKLFTENLQSETPLHLITLALAQNPYDPTLTKIIIGLMSKLPFDAWYIQKTIVDKNINLCSITPLRNLRDALLKNDRNDALISAELKLVKALSTESWRIPLIANESRHLLECLKDALDEKFLSTHKDLFVETVAHFVKNPPPDVAAVISIELADAMLLRSLDLGLKDVIEMLLQILGSNTLHQYTIAKGFAALTDRYSTPEQAELLILMLNQTGENNSFNLSKGSVRKAFSNAIRDCQLDVIKKLLTLKGNSSINHKTIQEELYEAATNYPDSAIKVIDLLESRLDADILSKLVSDICSRTPLDKINWNVLEKLFLLDKDKKLIKQEVITQAINVMALHSPDEQILLKLLPTLPWDLIENSLNHNDGYLLQYIRQTPEALQGVLDQFATTRDRLFIIVSLIGKDCFLNSSCKKILYQTYITIREHEAGLHCPTSYSRMLGTLFNKKTKIRAAAKLINYQALDLVEKISSEQGLLGKIKAMP